MAEGKVFWQGYKELVFVFCVSLHLIEVDSIKMNLVSCFSLLQIPESLKI